jgi:energy-converting hydrogenase Eha subunit G
MPPAFLIFIWIVFGLPSLIAGFLPGVVAIHGRGLWRLRQRKVGSSTTFSGSCFNRL